MVLKLLFAALFSMLTAVYGANPDGPGRFDLAVDLRGRWSFANMTGCQEYMAVTGTNHFSAGPMLCQVLPTRGMTQMIWQDCLEMTISGDSSTSPLHHMILNENYTTDDWTQAGKPARWTSKIVSAGSQDLDAASPVVVFNIQGDSGLDVARRYIDSQGQLVMTWSAKNATFRLFFSKEAEVPCNGYDPVGCADRTYVDGEGSAGWTPACCLQDYGSHQANPNKLACLPSTTSTTTVATATSTTTVASVAHRVLARAAALVLGVALAH